MAEQSVNLLKERIQCHLLLLVTIERLCRLNHLSRCCQLLSTKTVRKSTKIYIIRLVVNNFISRLDCLLHLALVLFSMLESHHLVIWAVIG